MKIQEAYDKIDGKWVKDETEFKHYTSVENFKKILNCGYIMGKYYPGNTYGYGEDVKTKPGENKEVCLVRSDRVPDNIKGLKLSENIGDIKFCFKKDTLEKVFGKVKPINEYNTQIIHYVKDVLIKNIKKGAVIKTPKLDKTIDLLKKKGWRLTKEETEEVLKVLRMHLRQDEYIIVKHDLTSYIPDQWNSNEKMESRVKAKKIPLEYVEKVLIPDYLKGDEKLERLVREHFWEDYDYYECRFPKEDVKEKK